MDDISQAEMQEINALVGETGPSSTGLVGRGGYDGAARHDKQIAGWRPPLQSADLDMLPDKELLDARSRDIGRNDAYVQNGARTHQDSIVGDFFMLSSQPSWSVLGMTQEWAEEFQAEVEELFTLWAESPQNWVDASRQNDFTSLLRLAVGVSVFGGEVLATAEWPKQQSREFRTAIQMVDADRLSTPPSRAFDERIRGGIKQDPYGAPMSAFIRTAHPSESWLTDYRGHYWREVPWRKPWGRAQVLYFREQQRVGQTRAVSDIAAGLREIAITRKFRDVTLQKAVLAATYAATIESELPSSAVYEQLGASNGQGTLGGATVDYAEEYLGAINEYVGASKNMLIDGVKVPHLFPGTKLHMTSAGDPKGVGQEFEQSLLRYISAALGVSYEELSKDFTKTNYSGAKAAMANTRRFMQARKRIFADSFATAIFRLWLEEAINQNKLKTFPASMAPMLYTDGHQNMMFDAIANCKWIGASHGQIDELKETQAAVLRIKFGLSTHSDELSRLGKDWRKTYAQLEKERKERENRGIVLEEGNSVNAASGSPREPDDPNDETSGDEEAEDAEE